MTARPRPSEAAPPRPAGPAPQCVVIDTNIALDLLVFGDAAALPLAAALADGRLHWLATPAMQEEFARVLGYPQIVRSLSFHQREAAQVLDDFTRHVRPAADAPRARYVCKDADDQKFIDLAVAHRTLLISKDRAVLGMARRLQTLGVRVSRQWMPSA